MPRPIAEQVVVITGASSGIGRETARRFAREGATVVLAARDANALAEVEREITQVGGHALAMPADVADWSQVQTLAGQAVERYGRIDTWVNNAAVALFGSFEDTPVEEFRRVIDVNLMGQVHGAKAALPHLKSSGGALIGIGSDLSEVPAPLQSAYTASKHALKGFYDTIRLEQQHARSGVQVSFLMPCSIDTPLFAHAKTYLGTKPGALPPVYSPRIVADAVLHAAASPVRDMLVGAAGAGFVAVDSLLPRYGDALMEMMAYRSQYTDLPKGPNDANNLWQPVPGSDALRGGLRALPFDPYTWLRTHPVVRSAVTAATLAAVVLAPVAALVLGRRRPLGS